LSVIRITPAGTQEQQPGNAGFGAGPVPAVVDMLGPIQPAAPGSLFLPMGPAFFNGYAQFFSSTDGGATWAPDSSGVQQACRNWAADWNPTTGLFTVAYLANTNPGNVNPVQVRQYNPSTQTWAAPFAVAGPSTASVLSVRTRSNGDVVVIHVNLVQYVASVFSGGAWTNLPLDLGLGITIPVTPTATSCVDSADVVHVAAFAQGGATVYLYFRVLANNTLYNGGLGLVLTDVPTNVQGLGMCAVSNAGNYVLYPFVDGSGNLNVEVMTGLSGVPTFSPGAIASTAAPFLSPISGQRFLGPSAFIFGGVIRLAITDGINQAWEFNAAELSPTGPYTQAGPIVALASEPSLGRGPTAGLFFVTGLLAFDSADSGTGLVGRYTTAPLVVSCNNPPLAYVGRAYSHTFVAAGGSPPFVFSLVSGSFPPGLTLDPATGVLSGVVTGSGVYTFVLEVMDSTSATATVTCTITALILQAIGGGGGYRPTKCGCSPAELAAERLRQALRRRERWPYDFIFPPSETVPVNELHFLSAPLAGGPAVVVFSFLVPAGYRFFLDAIQTDYTEGSPFQPGAALWTVDVNSLSPNAQAMPVQGLTALPVPLGSVAFGTRWPFERPYEFAALSVVRSTVQNVSLVGGEFSSGFFGYLVADPLR
jgi:hypothetical protein